MRSGETGRLVLERMRRRRQGSSGGRGRSRLLWGAAGAALGGVLTYFLDPDRGRRRRHVARDRTTGQLRRQSRRLLRRTWALMLYTLGRARGLVHHLRPPVAKEPPDDVTLTHRVESVLFRDPHVPKGQISINTELGTVFLRGQVDQPELIRDLEQAVRRVAGVRDVENLLHLPGTTAPHPRPRHLARRTAQPASHRSAGG